MYGSSGVDYSCLPHVRQMIRRRKGGEGGGGKSPAVLPPALRIHVPHATHQSPRSAYGVLGWEVMHGGTYTRFTGFAGGGNGARKCMHCLKPLYVILLLPTENLGQLPR